MTGSVHPVSRSIDSKATSEACSVNIINVYSNLTVA